MAIKTRDDVEEMTPPNTVTCPACGGVAEFDERESGSNYDMFGYQCTRCYGFIDIEIVYDEDDNITMSTMTHKDDLDSGSVPYGYFNWSEALAS